MRKALLTLLAGITLISSGCAMPRSGEPVHEYIERYNNYGLGKVHHAAEKAIIAPVVNTVIQATPYVVNGMVQGYVEQKNRPAPQVVYQPSPSKRYNLANESESFREYARTNCHVFTAGSQIFAKCN